jgi:hypothetical protein
VIGGGYTGYNGSTRSWEVLAADVEIGMAGPVAEAVMSWRLAHGSNDWSCDEFGCVWGDHLMGITAFGGGRKVAAEVAATGLDEHVAIFGAGIIITREWVAVDAIARALLLKPSWSLDAGDIARLWTAHRNNTFVPVLPSLAGDAPW